MPNAPEEKSGEDMNADDYVRDPCGAASLPFWKTEGLAIPEGVRVIRDDAFHGVREGERDEPYFRLRHDLEAIPRPALPPPFAFAAREPAAFAEHIRACYAEEHIRDDELADMIRRPVYDPSLWVAVADPAGGQIAASGIAELDRRIGEGVLEWIQVSPGFRRLGLGRCVVCELLSRMRGKARFATVSGRVNHPDRPMALYLACGFTDPVIWHVVTRTPGDGTADEGREEK